MRPGTPVEPAKPAQFAQPAQNRLVHHPPPRRRQSHFQEAPLPLFAYCGAAETADIIIPYNGLYSDAPWLAAAAAAPPRPLTDRADEAFAAWTPYTERYAATPSTRRRGADGAALINFERSPRTELQAWAAGRPAAERLHIGREQRGMAAWADSRYLVHVDGISCSAKLEKARRPGAPGAAAPRP